MWPSCRVVVVVEKNNNNVLEETKVEQSFKRRMWINQAPVEESGMGKERGYREQVSMSPWAGRSMIFLRDLEIFKKISLMLVGIAWKRKFGLEK